MTLAEISDPAPCHTALLIIDMINDLEFADGSAMFADAQRAGEKIAVLCESARGLGVPVVYVNDNYGQWHSERSLIVEHCSREGALGRPIVNLLKPDQDDFFVIKPQFSGFYSTNLPALLPRLGAQRLILTGVAADVCVLFTAADAHMREYEIWVPSDCVASSDPQRTRWALEIMRSSMQAETNATDQLGLAQWLVQDRPS
ncbi:MAG: isochorismatase family cysteine hydrolase [Pseudomonadota bacterium]